MVLETYVKLAKEDTDESWKKIDLELSNLKDRGVKYQLSVLKELPTLLKDERGSIRDLAASCLSSISTYEILDKGGIRMEASLVKNLRKIESLIVKRPKRGIFDENQYAQLRAVIAAIDYNWLDRFSWLGGAKNVLERHKNEEGLEKITREYLEKGTKLYGLI